MTELVETKETIKAGRKFRTAFQEMASAGYQWSVENDGGLVFEKKAWSLGGKDEIGGPLTAMFTAVAEKPGVYEFSFTHKRPWEKEVQARVRYTLTVEP